MSRLHAILAPSAAERWLTCSKSARMEEKVGESKSSEFADEGSFAHLLGEVYIMIKLKYKGADRQYAELQEHEWWEKYWNKELDGYAHDYADFVLMKFFEAKKHDKHAKLILEAKLALDEYVPESWGHVDAGIISSWKIITIDLKYGKGVAVDAADNKQQMLYALGLITAWQNLYGAHEVEMNVFQPRIDNTTEFTISIEDLLGWATKVLIPRAKLAFEGKGEFVAGTHCKFCNFRLKCKAYSDEALSVARLEFEEPTELSDKDIAKTLLKIPMFKNWVSMIEEYALDQAVKHGKQWPGLKLVEGRSNRVFTDEKKVEAVLLKKGLKPDAIYQPRKLFGITALEKNLGKDVFTKLLNKLVVKPPGSLTLVSVNDKRLEHNSISKATEDFM